MTTRLIRGLSSRRGMASVASVAWMLAAGGLLTDRWQLVAIALLLLLTAVAALTASLVSEVRRHDLRTRLRTGQLWGLAGLLNGSGSVMPALEGSAISIEGAHALASLVRDHRPNTVVELGPGASTVLIHLAGSAGPDAPQITALEHDERYVVAARRLADRLSLSGFTLIHAPLRQWTLPSGWSGPWYDPDAIAALPSHIDLLVVDGPPNHEGADNRYPALPLLEGRLGAGALIYVDDTERQPERRMVERWVEDFDCEVVMTGETFVLLRRRAGATDGP